MLYLKTQFLKSRKVFRSFLWGNNRTSLLDLYIHAFLFEEVAPYVWRERKNGDFQNT